MERIGGSRDPYTNLSRTFRSNFFPGVEHEWRAHTRSTYTNPYRSNIFRPTTTSNNRKKDWVSEWSEGNTSRLNLKKTFADRYRYKEKTKKVANLPKLPDIQKTDRKKSTQRKSSTQSKQPSPPPIEQRKDSTSRRLSSSLRLSRPPSTDSFKLPSLASETRTSIIAVQDGRESETSSQVTSKDEKTIDREDTDYETTIELDHSVSEHISKDIDTEKDDLGENSVISETQQSEGTKQQDTSHVTEGKNADESKVEDSFKEGSDKGEIPSNEVGESVIENKFNFEEVSFNEEEKEKSEANKTDQNSQMEQSENKSNEEIVATNKGNETEKTNSEHNGAADSESISPSVNVKDTTTEDSELKEKTNADQQELQKLENDTGESSQEQNLPEVNKSSKDPSIFIDTGGNNIPDVNAKEEKADPLVEGNLNSQENTAAKLPEQEKKGEVDESVSEQASKLDGALPSSNSEESKPESIASDPSVQQHLSSQEFPSTKSSEEKDVGDERIVDNVVKSEPTSNLDGALPALDTEEEKPGNEEKFEGLAVAMDQEGKEAENHASVNATEATAAVDPSKENTINQESTFASVTNADQSKNETDFQNDTETYSDVKVNELSERNNESETNTEKGDDKVKELKEDTSEKMSTDEKKIESTSDESTKDGNIQVDGTEKSSAEEVSETKPLEGNSVDVENKSKPQLNSESVSITDEPVPTDTISEGNTTSESAIAGEVATNKSENKPLEEHSSNTTHENENESMEVKAGERDTEQKNIEIGSDQHISEEVKANNEIGSDQHVSEEVKTAPADKAANQSTISENITDKEQSLSEKGKENDGLAAGSISPENSDGNSQENPTSEDEEVKADGKPVVKDDSVISATGECINDGKEEKAAVSSTENTTASPELQTKDNVMPQNQDIINKSSENNVLATKDDNESSEMISLVGPETQAGTGLGSDQAKIENTEQKVDNNVTKDNADDKNEVDKSLRLEGENKDVNSKSDSEVEKKKDEKSIDKTMEMSVSKTSESSTDVQSNAEAQSDEQRNSVNVTTEDADKIVTAAATEGGSEISKDSSENAN